MSADPTPAEQIARWVADAPRATLLPGSSPPSAELPGRSAWLDAMLTIGGIAIDGGWLRLLGLGHPTIGAGLPGWNEGLGGQPLDPPIEDALVVAYDAIGGFFVLEVEPSSGALGQVRYRSTEDVVPYGLGMDYAGFLEWALSGAVGQFYEANRWPGWQSDIAAVGPDHGFMIYPPIGFDGPPLSRRHRGVVPARELWTYAATLSAVPDGGKADLEVR